MSAIEILETKWGHNHNTYTDWQGTHSIFVATPDSAGGWDIETKFYNASGRTIKYVTFFYEAYNAVLDVINCTVKNDSTVSGKLTGPIEPNEIAEVHWDKIFYNSTAKTFRIKKVIVQYMDNTEEEIGGFDLTNVFESDGKTLNKESIYYENRGRAEELEAERKKIEEAERQKERDEHNRRVAKVFKRIVFPAVCAHILLLIIANIATSC